MAQRLNGNFAASGGGLESKADVKEIIDDLGSDIQFLHILIHGELLLMVVAVVVWQGGRGERVCW